MIGNPLRRRLRRAIAVLGVLVAGGAAVVLPSSPAQAVYISQGTFLIRSDDLISCFAVSDNRRDNSAIVGLALCNGAAANQRWKIYQLDPNVRVFQINAYDGEWPLNKCLDLPESNSNVTIYGCHGGSQQRFDLPSPFNLQRLKRYGSNDCIGALKAVGLTNVLNHKFDCANSGARLQFTLIQLT